MIHKRRAKKVIEEPLYDPKKFSSGKFLSIGGEEGEA